MTALVGTKLENTFYLNFSILATQWNPLHSIKCFGDKSPEEAKTMFSQQKIYQDAVDWCLEHCYTSPAFTTIYTQLDSYMSTSNPRSISSVRCTRSSNPSLITTFAMCLNLVEVLMLRKNKKN